MTRGALDQRDATNTAVRGDCADPAAKTQTTRFAPRRRGYVVNANAMPNNASGMPVVAENNWWGCNFGPGVSGAASPGCSGATNGVSAGVDANPWLVLKLESLVSQVVPSGGTNLTANLLNSVGCLCVGVEH